MREQEKRQQEKRAQRRRQEDAAFYKMLLWLGGSALLEGLALLLRRLYLDFDLTMTGVGIAGAIGGFFGVFRFAGALLFAAGCVWLYINLKKRTSVLWPAVSTGVVLWLWIAAVFTYGQNEWGFTVMCILPAVVAVLSAIYYLYQREFFFNALLCSCGVTALYVYRKIYEGHPGITWLGFVLVWLGLIGAALLARRLQSGEGKWMDWRLFAANASYPPIYLTCAVVALSLLGAILLGNPVAYYAIFAVVGWLFCLAVYYTVKLM